MIALQVFCRVNVFGFFLLVLFAGTFLTGGFRDILVFLILSLALVLLLLGLGPAQGCTGKNK